MKQRSQQGFTLTEMGILLLVIVATLGIAVPVLVIEQRRAQLETAVEHLRQMADPVMLWLRDTDPLAEAPLRVLVGPGKPPEPALVPNEAGDLLVAMTQGNPLRIRGRRGAWNGPYINVVPIDPWGRAYLLAGLREEDEHLWILTAGPNGIVETSAKGITLEGDDLGFRIR